MRGKKYLGKNFLGDIILGLKNLLDKKKIMSKKSFCQQNLGSEIFFCKNVFWSIKNLDEQFFGLNKFWIKQIFGSKKFLGQKNFWVKKIFGSKKFWGQKIFVEKNLGSTKF